MNRLQLKNDQFRQAIITHPVSTTGKYVLTRGVAVLTPYNRTRVLHAVKTDTTFTEDNDPHEEHDFGVIELLGIPKIFWKIDYFESEKMDIPEDPEWGEREEDFINAYRLLTIMLADEY